MTPSRALKFSDDELAGLFWILGELDSRSSALFLQSGNKTIPCKAELEAIFLHMYAKERPQGSAFSPWMDEIQIRARVALQGLERIIVRRERFGAEEARRLITSGIREWLDAAYRTIPEDVIAAA